MEFIVAMKKVVQSSKKQSSGGLEAIKKLTKHILDFP